MAAGEQAVEGLVVEAPVAAATEAVTMAEADGAAEAKGMARWVEESRVAEISEGADAGVVASGAGARVKVGLVAVE